MLLRRHFLNGMNLIAAGLALTGCTGSADRPVEVVVVGEPGAPFRSGVRLSPPTQIVRSATAEGLVGFDEQGRVVPALADRWIVTDDGQSYIFRLRDGTWPDGSPITGATARSALIKALGDVRGTALGLDLAGIDEIREMAGRVIEIRLVAPMPDLLQLLAQPELGLLRGERGSGPMKLQRSGRLAILRPIPPEKRGLPSEEGWEDRARAVNLRALAAPAAIERFDTGDADIVLGGGIDEFPRLDVAGLSRGAIRVDPVQGLFGLTVTRAQGFLESPANREAIAMAIDREALIASFGVTGWTATTRIVAPGSEGDQGSVGERWLGVSMAERRSTAAERVARWQAGKAPAVLRIALPGGPGGDRLWQRLSADLKAIGLATRRVGPAAEADLRLIDLVARYSRPEWYLNQLSCVASRGLCNAGADTRVTQARKLADLGARAELLADAEAALTTANTFIPFGSPIRWSLVSGNANGFAVNRWGIHPLLPLAMRQR